MAKTAIFVALMAAVLLPEGAFARESDQNDVAICTDPKHRHTVVRTLTEQLPVRKKDKVRVRRILM